MSLDVDVAVEGTRVPIALRRVAALAQRVLRAEGVRDASLSIAVVGAAAIAAIKRRHLGHPGPTDVISFPIAAAGGAPRGGDVYSAPEVARANARRHGAGVREEIARLVVHAVLHVLGHDHPDGEDRTTSPRWTRQEALVRRFATEWRA